MCVGLYQPSGCVVINVFKGYFHHMTHMVNHVLDVTRSLFSIRVDWCLPCAGLIIMVGFGCSEFGLDHIAFLLGCNNNLLGTR